MSAFFHDIRFAVRALRRDLGFTVLAVFTLAVGIGINTAVFSVIDSVLLEPLPYREPDRLVMLWTENPAQGVTEASSAYGNIRDWRARSRSFEDLATFDFTVLTLTGGEWAERVGAARSSANLFEVLGVAPLLGRTFSEAEAEGRESVAVVSHEFWRSRFGGAHDVLGRMVDLNGAVLRVVGVMPEGFDFPGGTALWIPQSHRMFEGWEAAAERRGTDAWRVVGRLRPDVSLEEARAEMRGIAARLAEAHPENAGLGVSVIPLDQQVAGRSFRVSLWMLFGAVGLLLLIACANAAHLILVRGVARARELSLRVALGATTGRIVRQLLRESLVLGAAAGIGGVLLAVPALRLLVAVAPDNLPRLETVAIDRGVLVYAVALSFVAAVLFGIAPALTHSRRAAARGLREGRGPAGSAQANRARAALIVAQFAMAIILVFGSNLLVRSLLEARAIEPGFDSENVLLANLSVESQSARLAYYERAVEEVQAIPGVRAAGLVEEFFIGGSPNRFVTVEGSAAAEPAFEPMRIDAIAGEALRAMGVSLLEGRDFSASDGTGSAPVAIINEAMARRFWPGESPIGKRFRTDGPDGPWVEVVGLVANMRRQGPEREPISQAFRPYSQAPSRNMNLLVRTDAPTPGLAVVIRSRLAGIDRSVPVYGVTTLTDALDRQLLIRRFQTLLLGVFSAIALLLAAIGIYGLIQYTVSQRTRELGIRVALGAPTGGIVRMILRQGLTLAGIGLAAGIVIALLLSGTISTLLFGVRATDPMTVLVTSGILLATAAAACLVPARRAARVEPIEAMRG